MEGRLYVGRLRGGFIQVLNVTSGDEIDRIAPCPIVHGIAKDEDTGRLFFGCTNDTLVVGTLGDEVSQTIARSASPEAQTEYLETIFHLLVRRPAVNVVAWRRAFDHDNRRFPLSGLCGETEKPMLETYSHWVEEVSD